MSVTTALPMLIKLEPLGGSGMLSGFYTEAVLRTNNTPRPLGVVRLTVCGPTAKSDPMSTLCAFLVTEIWQIKMVPNVISTHWVSKHSEVSDNVLKTFDNEATFTTLPIKMKQQDNSVLWLHSLSDLREKNEGVRAVLSLQVSEEVTDYCFIHVLTSSIATLAQAGVAVAEQLWGF